MSEPTPGPWKLVERAWHPDGFSLDASRYEQSYWVATGRPGSAVALVGHTGGGLEEAEANAHLIAAAPDMLAALKAADKYPCVVCGKGYGKHFKDCIVGNAIAKAKGETL